MCHVPSKKMLPLKMTSFGTKIDNTSPSDTKCCIKKQANTLDIEFTLQLKIWSASLTHLLTQSLYGHKPGG